MEIFIDADACPVKDEAVKVATRHDLIIHMVSNKWMRHDENPLIRRVVVGEGPDEADNWIVDHICENDIVITSDIPLAARCLEKNAHALGPSGKPFTEDSIGMALAMRNLNAHLRESGEISSQHKPFAQKDKSRFLMVLEEIIQSVKRQIP